MGETPKSKKGKKSPPKINSKNVSLTQTPETDCITLSFDEDEPMEIQKEKTLANKDENNCITLSSDEEMEVRKRFSIGTQTIFIVATKNDTTATTQQHKADKMCHVPCRYRLGTIMQCR